MYKGAVLVWQSYVGNRKATRVACQFQVAPTIRKQYESVENVWCTVCEESLMYNQQMHATKVLAYASQAEVR